MTAVVLLELCSCFALSSWMSDNATVVWFCLYEHVTILLLVICLGGHVTIILLFCFVLVDM